MPPPSVLSKMALWLRYWLLSDNYRSTKAYLHNIEETNEGPCRSNRLAGRPKAALLFWFFGDFRCGALLFMVIHVIYKYKNK